jgi:hypothetical protein
LTATCEHVEDGGAAHPTTHETTFLQLCKIVAYVLAAPTIDAADLRRIIADLNALENWDQPGPNSLEVKFDF